MHVLFLILAIILMALGGILAANNPEPVTYWVGLGERGVYVQANIVEIMVASALCGVVAMLLPYGRAIWAARQERRRLEDEGERLREDNTALRRDAENARSNSRLLEARLAEAEERYAALEAQARPLLTTQKESSPETAAEAEPEPAPDPPKPRSRWQRRR